MKKLAILGATGSIGTQTLEIVRENPELFSVEIISGNKNTKLLIKQALEFNPNIVIIADENKYYEVANVLQDKGIKVFAGKESIDHVCEVSDFDILVQAITGFAGFAATYNAIKAGKHIALANKESLVVGGEKIIKMAIEHKVAILPIDSEHSAIFQCLQGEQMNKIRRLLLTASGGPFRGKNKDFLKKVTPEMALKHPTWNMGAKITIDSATMMNKGFEIIEAKLLFDVDIDKIEIVVHQQSVIHSMVEFYDGSIKAQLGYPSMKIPISYALMYPQRINSSNKPFSFIDYQQLTFEQVDEEIFSCIAMAREAMRTGGTMTTVLNAANEVGVYAFLDKKIRFNQIPEIIEEAMKRHQNIKEPSFDDIIETDSYTRENALAFIKK